MSKHGRIGLAALRAGLHRNTARRYVEAGQLPSELKQPRSWRTREDPFAEDWEEIAQRLSEAPELEARTVKSSSFRSVRSHSRPTEMFGVNLCSPPRPNW